jgi:hypothetical protein
MKKNLEFTLRSLMMLSIVVLLAVFLPGTKVYAFSGGAGTIGNPYQIVTLADLKQVSSSSLSNSYILENNIDASSTTLSSIGTSSTPYTGCFYGNGCVINGVTIYGGSYSYVGFFSNMQGAVVSNLGLTNVTISGYSFVGGMFGGCRSTTISDCFVTGTVTGSSDVGGFGGESASGTNINDCWVNVTSSGMQFVSTSTTTYQFSNFYGMGKYAMGTYGNITETYSSWGGDEWWYYLTNAQMKVQSNYVGFDFTNVWIMDGVNYGGYPYQRIFMPRPPSIPTLSESATGWTNANVTITMSSTAGSLPIQGYQFYNGSSWVAVTGNTFIVSAEGATTLQFRAIDTGGNNSTSSSITTYIDKTCPTATLPSLITNISSTGYDVYVYGVKDPVNSSNSTSSSGISTVSFATWTTYNGTDDLVTANGTNQGAGTWYYRVNRSSHNNEFGAYNTNIGIYDVAGNSYSISTGGATLYAAPTVLIITPTNGSTYTN